MNFTWIDWAVIAFVMAGTTWAGHLLSGRTKGMDAFFAGGRSLPWWAVSGSIMASQISAVSIIAVPAMVFKEGGNLLFLQGTLFGFVLAKFLMAYLFIKPYYERHIFSPYDFIENRLGAGPAQIARVLFLISAILGHSIRVLTVALVLNVVVPQISIGISILIIGVFSVLWTWMGGIKTVVWTDCVLFVLMVLGAVLSVLAVFHAVPVGIGEMIRELDQAAKLRLIDISLDPAKTWTIWTGLICFAVFELAQNSVDQVISQRMVCCRNYVEARKAILSSLAIVVFTLLLCGVGLALWLHAQHVPYDPQIAAALKDNPNQAYPYFIVHHLPTGFSGLLIACIFAAGISTLDSALSALAETTVNGMYLKWIRPDASEKTCMFLTRASVLVWGIVLCGLAYFAGKLVQNDSLLNLAYKAPVVTYGSMLVIALFALWRRVSLAAVSYGVAAGMLTALISLILISRKVIAVDELWLYPLTSIICFIVALAYDIIRPGNKAPLEAVART